jgi:hypothetical protein
MAFSGSINFISASLTGSDNINVDFVGLNTLIIDPVSSSLNVLGYSDNVHSAEYFNDVHYYASAKISFAGSVTPGRTITIISTDGTAIEYTAAPATDTSANEFQSGVGGNVARTHFITCVNDASNGHGGKILAAANGNTGTTYHLILTQLMPGKTGRTATTSNLDNTTIADFAFYDGEPNQLNSLLLHRNGPYQHPSWKQSRGGDHPIARKLRMNNTMSVDIRDPDPFLREERKRNERHRLEEVRPNEHTYTVIKGADGQIVADDRLISSSHPTNPGVPQTLGQFYVPVVTSKHKPLVYTYDNMKVRASFMNQMIGFSSEEQNAKLKFSSGDPSTGSHDVPGETISFKSSNIKVHKLIEMAKNSGGQNFIYSERIHPKEINSYRDYKLERPNYEQSSGLEGYDSSLPRLFWKNTQGGDSSRATSNGTTRLRTDGVAKNSADTTQQTTFPESYSAASFSSARQLISGSASFVSSTFGTSPGIQGTASYTNNVVTNSLDLGLQGLVVEYINNGVVVNRYQTYERHLPLPGTNAHISGVLFQLDSYQPYQPSLLSSWPLDARNDIYSKPPYLTSSIGGKGLQIGLTPHRNSNLINNPSSHDSLAKLSGTFPALTSSIINAVSNLQTASAGELAYSTKPTIFFWRNTNTHSTSSMSFVAESSTTTNQLFSSAAQPTEKFELEDLQGNRVGFHFIAGSSTADGSTVNTSGSTFVQVGFNGIANNAAGTQTLFRRIETAVNGVNSINNGLKLNVSASYNTNAFGQKILIFHQLTPGTGPSNVLTKPKFSQNITGPKYELTNINIFAGNFNAVQDADDMFEGLLSGSNGTVQSLRDDGIMGYKAPTASLQYNRHTFPYNTPFYATTQFRGRNPFYNSYNDFIDSSLKYFGRDHSIFSEFRYSENIKYYNKTFNGITSKEALYTTTPSSYVGQNSESKKIVRNANILEKNATNVHKANSRLIEGGNITSSAGVETYPSSSTRHRYDDINGAVVDTISALLKTNYLNDATSTKFDNEYEQTDSMKNFSFTLDSLVSGYTAGDQTIPSKIRINASVIKKLLPYNGFFPATRTVQIGNALINDFTGALGFKGSMDASAAGQLPQDNQSGPAYAQALLEPLMAPGILYNSIKSGVAVDYPIYTQKPNYFNPSDFSSAENENGIGASALKSTFHGGLYMMGASRCIPSILTSLHDKRLPFRALYDLDVLKNIVSPSQGTRLDVHLVSDFIDLDRATKSPHASLPQRATSGSIDINNPKINFPSNAGFSSIEKGTYLSMINNYLSETMEFFLADLNQSTTKLPVAVSSFVNQNNNLSEDKEYTFETSLRQGKYNIMCEGPRKAGIGRPEGILEKTSANSGYYVRNSSMRGYIYGPPLEVAPMLDRNYGYNWDNENFEFKSAFVGHGQYDDYLAANLQDPAYHAYTPPYFYGKSSIVYRIKPLEAQGYATQELVQQLTNPGSDTTDRTFFVDEYTLPTSGSNGTHRFIVDEDSLTIAVPTTGSASKASTAKMKINSSVPSSGKLIEVKTVGSGPLKTTGEPDHVWAIYPEWICPVLDFSGSVSAIREKVASINPDDNQNLLFDEKLNVINNTFHDKTTGRGMWGGYGTDPYDTDLMTLSLTRNGITDEATQTAYLEEKGIYFSIDDFSSTSDTKNNQSTDSTFVLGTDDSKFSSLIDTTTTEDSESLLQRLGLDKNKFPVGKFADGKDISEAIVLIPYLDKEISLRTNKQAGYSGGENFDENRIYQTREIIPGKHFLPIHERLFENILSLYVAEKTIGPDAALDLNLYGTVNDEFSNNTAETYKGQATKRNYLRAARTEAIENTDVGRLIDKISAHSENGGYMIPPEFDFVHNKNVAPFQMLVIPFSETLDKQDLIDIYQGIMPESSLHVRKDESSTAIDVTFSPSYGELYIPDFPGVLGESGITNFLSPALFLNEDIRNIKFESAPGVLTFNLVLGPTSPGPSILPYSSSREFYRNLRFMVFKVKQRSKKDYSNYKLSQIYKAADNKLASIEGNNMTENNNEKQMVLYKTPADIYGSNWPYDHFSLIESGKIDIEIEVDG